MSSKKYPWPQHELTAFVLGELDAETETQIEAAAATDAALAMEIAEIRAMVNQLSELYKHESADIAATTFVTPAGSAGVPKSTVQHSAVQRSEVQRPGRKFSWTAAVGLIAMAASLLIAVALATPALQNYFAQPSDVLARTDANSAGNKGESADRLASAGSANAQLQARLADAKEEIHETPTPNFSDGESDGLKQLQAAPSATLAAMPSEPKPIDESQSVVRQDFLSDGEANEYSIMPSPGAEGGRGLTDGVNALSKQSVTDAVPSKPASDEKLARGGMMGGMGGGMGDGMGSGGYGGMGMGAMGMGGMAGTSLGAEGGMGMEGGGMGMTDPQRMSLATNLTPRLMLEEEEHLSELAESDSGDAEHRFMFRRKAHPFAESKSNSDRYAPIYENRFKQVESEPLSTFSIDVDTASYVKTRQYLMESRSLPPANAVRIEEFINYFEYEYGGPQGDDPFAASLAVANCPWRSEHKLVRIALQAKKVDVSERPKANIVFLLDVSGSMDEPNKLPLVKESLRLMIEQLTENDRIAMVVYAGAAGCVLESTTGDKKEVILGALDRLNAGGSTNGGQGIQLAYEIARDHFVPGGVNRVILCTDGDFNVGTTSTEELVAMVAENAKSKVFLTVLGYGMGNTNDAMMEQIANRGNGVYGMVDSRREARRQMVKQLAGNLMTVAKDVKVQVEFNPQRVASYRLIGYENRMLAKEDFANDKKDAGDIGAGHRVTALYEVEPIGAARVQPAPEQELRYQKPQAKKETVEPQAAPADETSDELLAVKLRYKQPEGDTSKLLTFPLVDGNKPFAEADSDFKWAATVAQFAMLLRGSNHRGSATWSGLVESAAPLANDETRRECLQMMRTAQELQR